MYKAFIRPLLFLMPPERAHHFTFGLVKLLHRIPGVGAIHRALFQVKHPKLERELFGIRFPNPVGLAAGFDKDAKLFRELGNYGFGFIEIGTLTPVGQPGNPKPRMFRLKGDTALINRMGFNNGGTVEAIERLKVDRGNLIVGGFNHICGGLFSLPKRSLELLKLQLHAQRLVFGWCFCVRANFDFSAEAPRCLLSILTKLR